MPDAYQHPLLDGRPKLDTGPARRPRVGQPSDMRRMMDLTMTASDENSVVRPSPRRIAEDVWPALHRDRGIVWIIGPDEGPLEGAALLRVVSPWYSEDEILEERGIYVHPHHRHHKGQRARMLIQACAWTARQLDLILFIGVLSNQRTEGKRRLYERQLGPPAGYFFLSNGRTGDNLNIHTGGAVGGKTEEA